MADVREFGAVGDGKALDTAALQAAIDDAAAQGTEVRLAHGTYRSGTLHLRDNVTISIRPAATLLASADERDFDPIEDLPYAPWADQETHSFAYALLAGLDVARIRIVGGGTIADARGHRYGPKPIALKRCRDTVIRDITIVDAPNYAVSLLGCDNVVVDGVTIRNAFADGIDPDCSRFVRIANCDIDAWDDAVCIKTSLSLGAPHPSEHITVTNCTIRSSCNNVKIGTETSGDVRDVAVSNCTMLGRPGDPPPDENSGVAIESVDGAVVEGVVVSNVVMHDVATPIFVRLGNRGRGLDPPRPGAVRGVRIQNIVAFGASQTSSITGLPDAPVRDIALAHVTIHSHADDGPVPAAVPEVEADYPRATMFGRLPAHGLYARHVVDLSLHDVVLDAPDDPREALVHDDVHLYSDP